MDLAKLRVPLDRARYFVATADRNPSLKLLDDQGLAALTAPRARQLTIFDAGATASEPTASGH